MDHKTLLNVVAELGYRLALSGAETFRIEESVNRITGAYGVHAEVFAIPNYLHISIETDDGNNLSRMRRIGYHGNDLEAVELYSNLSRRICRERPDPDVAMQWLDETKKVHRTYSLPIYLIGGFLGACGYSIFFGGGILDCLCAGVCGIVVGLINKFMDRMKANPFFGTITAAFIMAAIAYIMGILGVATNTDAVIIGTLMILVPGLLFTNAMRDIIYGDTNSGINRIVQVFLIAAAIALGTGAAWKLTEAVLHAPPSGSPIAHKVIIELIACFVGCYGFTILFNIHGGKLLCAIGGVLTWLCYRLVLHLSGNDIIAYFGATSVAALYSEIMARIRKFPALTYLVISAFPLIPGAGVYYTMNCVVKGDMAGFSTQGMHTIAIAGVMAVGILLISTIVRFTTVHIQKSK